MQMKNRVLAGALMLISAFATAADVPLAKEGAHEVIKAYTASIVAAYACRTTLDGGNGQYHQALSAAEEAFTRATDDRDKAKKMIAVLEKRIENEDPGAQLTRQFDEVNAGPELRQRSCEQLVSGSSQRAIEAGEKLKLNARAQ
ncbi:hypothetical protein JQ760_027870 (plasmid) [Klebsiella pneumoniae]|uniref:hypothetical protein n=1 Tax=Klebsiella pneumoniae TaxID=573 RepID=UPI001FAC65AA|nr:hypothetical protein [Klebsiella pneumoniae]MCI8108523.1 hypothetical protein [Klebsiella pneumoniae]